MTLHIHLQTLRSWLWINLHTQANQATPGFLLFCSGAEVLRILRASCTARQ